MVGTGGAVVCFRSRSLCLKAGELVPTAGAGALGLGCTAGLFVGTVSGVVGRGVKANGTAFVVNLGEPTILENDPIEIGLPRFI